MRQGRFRLRARGRDRERGASLVEFALVVPLLTLFLFGIVQFGIAYDKQQSLNSAAREGARTASLPDSDFTAIDQSVRSGFQGLDDDGDLTVVVANETTGYSGTKTGDGPVVGDSTEPCRNPSDGESVPGTTVIVTVSNDHVLTIPFFGAPTITIDGRGEFRCEEDIS